jgi:hypothetical protein
MATRPESLHAYASAHELTSAVARTPAHALVLERALQAARRLEACTEDQVPILRMLRSDCHAGFGGFACDVRWDLQDSFLPRPRRWLRQWNGSRDDPLGCQRAFFHAFSAVLTRMHWEQEW